jgi:uncharacterized protein YukE
MMEARVFPLMRQWKFQFEARLPARELSVLEGLRERYSMLQDNLNHNLAARQSAWERHDYASFTSMRTLLRNQFAERQRIYTEVTRFTEKNDKQFQYLAARIDSTVEEWRGSSMRMFTDWFTKYRSVIALAMNTPARDDLALLMAACRNIRLDRLELMAKLTFVLWDGKDYIERMRQSGFPESPLTDCGLRSEDILFVESASPNPFSTNTSIRFFVPSAGLTTVRVVDANGKTILQLLNEILPTGKTTVAFRANENMPAGTYYVLVEAGKAFDAIPVRYSR